MEPDNDNNKNYNSENNFKLKGPKGWAHSLKKGVKSIFNNAQNTFRDRMKNVFKVLLATVVSIAKILLPIIVFLASCWYVINTLPHHKTISTVNSYISNSTTISEDAKEAYEKSGSLLFLNNEAVKAISEDYLDWLERAENSLYKDLSNEEKIGDHKISSITYTEGFDISNAYEFILNSERMNFNRVSWKKHNRETGEITELETQVDKDTNLKYPKNEDDTTKDLKYFANMLMPYLQSYVVPSTMLSGTATKADTTQAVNFAFQIIDKGYHAIDVLQYTLQTAKRDQTMKHYVTKTQNIAAYVRERACPENGAEAICQDLGYNGRDLERIKENAEIAYVQALSDENENVEVYKNFDSEVEKEYVYPVIKADTLKNFMRVEYELKKYSDTDVANYENSNSSYITGTEKYTEVSGLANCQEIYGSGWKRIPGETLIVTVEYGEYVTTKYIWNDKIEEKYNEKREYETDDIAEFVNQIDKVVKVEEKELTEEEMKPGSRPDLRLDASDIFSTSEVNYYKELEEKEDITRIDMINAVPGIYNDYLYSDENYSKYIGFSRSYLSMSYTMLSKHLAKLETLKKSSYSLGLSFNIIGSNFIWPLENIGWASITSCSSTRIRDWDGGRSEYHGALDISNNAGTPIIASQSGVVYQITSGDSYGNKVVLKHFEDENYVYYTLCAHMQSDSRHNGLNLKVGDFVEAGQVIGYVGSTGDSSGPHLHFELIQWPKSDNNGNYYYNKKLYSLEPIYYIQRDTIPENILKQTSLPINCGDMTPDNFGQYASTSAER